MPIDDVHGIGELSRAAIEAFKPDRVGSLIVIDEIHYTPEPGVRDQNGNRVVIIDSLTDFGDVMLTAALQEHKRRRIGEQLDGSYAVIEERILDWAADDARGYKTALGDLVFSNEQERQTLPERSNVGPVPMNRKQRRAAQKGRHVTRLR